MTMDASENPEGAPNVSKLNLRITSLTIRFRFVVDINIYIYIIGHIAKEMRHLRVLALYLSSSHATSFDSILIETSCHVTQISLKLPVTSPLPVSKKRNFAMALTC